MMQRYRIAFLLSLLVFISLWATYLNLPQMDKKVKDIEKKVIKISLISPPAPPKVVVKKPVVITTPIIPKVKPKKVITKPKPKKIVKKVIKKIQPTKVVKKVIKKVIKKPKPKKIAKKVIKKIQPTKVVKKIIKQTKPKRVEPIVEKFYDKPEVIVKNMPIVKEKTYAHPPPTIVTVPNVQKPIAVVTKTTSNTEAKKAFLRHVRSKIIANKKYPKLARRRHIEGSVKVRFDISVQGYVQNIRFINGKRIFHKSIRKSLERTFPIGIPNNMRAELPIPDVSVTLHFNLR